MKPSKSSTAADDWEAMETISPYLELMPRFKRF